MSKIITTPNPVLREVSRTIADLNKKTLAIIRDVETTLTAGDHPKGVGLSAVQIGKPIRMFCLYLPKSGDPDDEKSRPLLSTFINPEIIKLSKEKTLGKESRNQDQELDTRHQKPILEGCLSIPGIWGPVWRHEWIKLRWQITSSSSQKRGARDKFAQPSRTRHSAWPDSHKGENSQERSLEGKRISVASVTHTFHAFPARVIQHELDHLNGILFTDHSMKNKLPLYESKGEELVRISM